ncbi:MAG TPA: hypothetical protein VJS69_13155 [Candidatus Krumholzibacteria bacterium]|nr:hypothetical protein [Candidatus Krumholzibacteria bacterium]
MVIPRLFSFIGVLALSAGAAFAQGPTKGAPGTMEAAAAASTKVIQTLQNAKAIKAYQWTETMVVMVEGKEKDTVVNTCSYNDAGGVARTAVDAKKSEQVAGGTPGTSVEIDSYVKASVGVMRQYVRPDPLKLQQCQDATRISVAMEDGGKHEKLTYRDYMKKGDNLTLVVDPATSQIISLTASTYMTNPGDRADIHTEMSQMPDGTAYPSHIKFDTPGRQMGMVVTNTNFQKKS